MSWYWSTGRAGPELLFVNELHALPSIRDDGGGIEVSVLVKRIAAAEDACPLVACIFHVTAHDLELHRIGERAEVGGLVHSVADPKSIGCGAKRSQHFGIEIFMYEESLQSMADLARIVERRAHQHRGDFARVVVG